MSARLIDLSCIPSYSPRSSFPNLPLLSFLLPLDHTNTSVQGLPVLDVCDADVSKLCLAEKGLDTHRVGEIRRCLVNYVAPQSPPDSSKVRCQPGKSQQHRTAVS